MTKKINYYMDINHYHMYPHTTNSLKNSKPSVKIVENGTILPAHDGRPNSDKLWADGGVIDENGRFIDESMTSNLFGGNYEYDHSDIEYIDEEVLFFGPFIRHWGHFICDQISRLWYIKNNPAKYKIAYCGWNWKIDPGNLDGNFLELLELLGCKKDQFINIQKPTKFKKIIIPDLAFHREPFYYTKEFEELTDIIVKNTLKNHLDAPSKIYFSRTEFNQGKEHGENKIEQIFKNNGYEIVHPEQLSVKKQITYFNKAKSIAMIAGSISHNLMFTKSNNIDVAILNKFSLVNNYQITIDSMTKASIISYIDCYRQPLPVLFGTGPFLITITKYLKKYLADNNLKINKIKKTYFIDSMWYLKKYYKTYCLDKNSRLMLRAQQNSVRTQKKLHKKQSQF